MSGIEDAIVSGAAHLTSFVGTDCVPAIAYLNEYYNGEATCTLVGTSVPATEHSTTCASIAYIQKELEEKGEWNGIKLADL